MAITPLPPAPLPSDSTSEFNSKAFAFVAALDPMVTQINAELPTIDAAADASAAAVAAANFKGEWSTLTGALAIPASVSHNGAVWVLTQSLADVTSNEPGVDSPNYWINVTIPAAGASGNLLTSNGTEWQSVASPVPSPGTSGNVLTSNGTAWTSAAPFGGVTQQLFTAGSALTGTFAKDANITGTYTRTSPSNVVTVTVANTLAAGDRVYLDYTSGTAVDGWQTVISATGANFTVTSSTTTTTSGNVTVGVPIVITVNDHGLSTANSVFVDFSGTYTDGTYTVYQATTNTFQVQSGTTTQNTSGTVTLPQITPSQTWTKPTGCKTIFVELCGGGGGGWNLGCCQFGGGGGGGYSNELIDVTSTSTVSVNVGVAGKVNAHSGGTTSFGSFLSATGGSTAVNGLGGNSGIGSNGTINLYAFRASVGVSGFSQLGSSTNTNNSGFGAGGTPNGSDNATSGVIIVTEYY